MVIAVPAATVPASADDIYESALPPPLRSQAGQPIAPVQAGAGNAFMLEEQLGQNPQVYYASSPNPPGAQAAMKIDNSTKIRALPSQWAPARPSTGDTIRFGNTSATNGIVSQSSKFVDTNDFRDSANFNSPQSSIGSGFRASPGYTNPAQSSAFSGVNSYTAPTTYYGNKKFSAGQQLNGLSQNSLSSGNSAAQQQRDSLSPDYDNSMRKPDRFADNPMIGPDGVRHFANGKHFDLSQMPIDQAVATVNTPDPSVIPPRRRQNQNQNQTALNNGFSNNFDAQQQQQQMRQQRRRRRELNNLLNGF